MKKAKIDQKIFCLVLALLAILVLSPRANAYFYKISNFCENDICIEGQNATWKTTISNDGNYEIELIGLELLEFGNNTAFVSMQIPYHPLSSFRGDIIPIYIGQKVSINITAPVPKANFNELLVYQPCFTFTVTDSYINAKEGKYTIRQCFNENASMPVIQCTQSSHCGDKSYCYAERCLSLNCSSCQYIISHQCVNYRCCANSQCRPDQICSNNTCINLGCSSGQYVENYTCTNLACGFDEFISNRSCKKLECRYDEFAFNHTCRALNCSLDQKIENSTCINLDCSYNEFAKNHKCLAFKCKLNESYYNHTCIPLKCPFYKEKINHTCVTDNRFVFRFAIEAAAVLIIIAFFALDIKNYEKVKIKKKSLTKENSEDIKLAEDKMQKPK